MATTQQKENIAVAWANSAAYVSLHTSDPGSSGSNEVVGGAYARVAATVTPGPVDGQVTVSATVNCPSGMTLWGVGFWTAPTGGTYLDKFAGAATSTGSVNVSITVAGA